MMVDAVGLYLMIFHVCGGDMREAGLWKGVSGTVFQVGGVCSLPLINWLCRRYEKKVVSRLSIAVVVAAGISKWFFYAPGAGWLVVVPSALLAPGLAAVLMLGPSMLADLCEVDQAEHGVRREGMFVATFYWLLKTCTSVIMLLSGVIIAFTGFRAEAGTIQSTDTILLMRLWFSGGTIALAVTSFVLLGRYTLTAEQLRTLRARTLPLAL
jgi:GPH family glycoside/pentoside/hexuronide:cation symporter